MRASVLTGMCPVAAGTHHRAAVAAAARACSPWITFGYARQARLPGVRAPEGPRGFTYDPAGNGLTRARAGVPTAYSYDRADRLAAAGGTGYTVNATGTTTGRGADTFVYDQVHRLTSATIGGATTACAYDGDVKRVSTTSGGTTTRSVYDVGGGLPRLLEDGTRKYVWRAHGLAYAVEGTGNGTVEVHHADGLGSVRALTDAAGAVVQTYETDEFGVPGVSQGTRAQPFGYTGEQRHGETGFAHLRARMYDPQVGRSLQRNPFAGFGADPLSLNRYTYVENNPTNATDPSGLATSQVLGGGAPATYQRSCLAAFAPPCQPLCGG